MTVSILRRLFLLCLWVVVAAESDTVGFMITEDFFNKYHSTKDGRFVSGGHAVTGPALPLRNSTTGRINPTQVRAAFKQPQHIRKPRESAANMNSRTKIGVSGNANKDTVVTHKTYKGREIRHQSTGGRAMSENVAALRNRFYDQPKFKISYKDLMKKGAAVTAQQARQTVMDDLNKISTANAARRAGRMNLV